MLGNIVEITKLLSNKDKLAERIKDELPPKLDVMLEALAEHAGAPDGAATALTFFMANTAEGPKRMVRISQVDAFGELGAEVSTLDVAATIRSIPNETIKGLLPF